MSEPTTARLLRQIREVCELAGAKTEEYARVSRKRLDVVSLGREIQKEKAALGERVYQLAREAPETPIVEDTTVQALIDRLRNLEESLQACEVEIADIRAAARDRVADVRRKYQPPEASAEASPSAEAPPAAPKETAAPPPEAAPEDSGEEPGSASPAEPSSK